MVSQTKVQRFPTLSQFGTDTLKPNRMAKSQAHCCCHLRCQITARWGRGWGLMQKNAETLYEQRRGTLKNGNPSGDFSKAPRCGARNRRGNDCQCPAMANGRCRLHGGLSTGAKTPEGIERIRRAVIKHGRYSARAKAEGASYRQFMQEARKIIASCGL